ncbi:MAG: hypothetical protein QOF51_4239 [Chloroflexota bacterium]|jgi:hypothetical protein|nr:hypothetical protein [Chloroflexota bacterium]
MTQTSRVGPWRRRQPLRPVGKGLAPFRPGRLAPDKAAGDEPLPYRNGEKCLGARYDN